MNYKKVCIIGGGLSGSVLAKYLLENTSFQIVVIDIDDIDKKYDLNIAPNNLYPFKNFEEDFITFAYGFGGSSNYWHGVLTDLDDLDLERIKKKCGSLDWITKEIGKTGLKLVPQLRFLNHIDKNKFRLLPLPEYLFENWEDKFFLVPKKPIRGRKVLKDLVKKYTNRIKLINNSIAIRLIFKEENNIKEINKIEINKNGEFKNIKADFFVCTLGALETPRLLLQSFPKEEFINKFAGKGLMDHPSAAFAEIKYKKKFRSNFFHSLMRSSYLRKGYKPRELINNRNPSLGLIAENKSLKNTLKNLYKNIFSGEEKTINNRFINPTLNLAAPSIHYLQRKLGLGIITKNYNIIYHHECLISDGGSVSLKKSKDKYGRLNTRLIYPSLDSFYENIDRISFNIKNLNNQILISKILLKKHSTISPIPGSHYSGTCRISDDPQNGICDINLKVHNFSNLFICDPSVIPIIGNSNLGLSIIRMASFLSSRLKEYISMGIIKQ